jgi:glutathione S-transferase
MELFYSPGACSLSPHIVLCETGLPHTLRKVDLMAKKIDGGGNFLEINPKGYVPALRLDDGRVLTEGPAIVQYLADLKPESRLAAPAGTFERYELQSWLNFISTELHKAFAPLFNPAATKEWREAALAGLRQRFNWLAPQLQQRQHVAGNAFSVADAYLFTVLNWGAYVKLDIGEWPALKEYQARIGARPRVLDALRAEGLVK